MGWGRVKSAGFQLHLAENRWGRGGWSLQGFSCNWRKIEGGGEGEVFRVSAAFGGK